MFPRSQQKIPAFRGWYPRRNPRLLLGGLNPHFAEARRRRAEGATLKELAQSYDVGLATILRLAV
jgi:hypothetical protein